MAVFTKSLDAVDEVVGEVYGHDLVKPWSGQATATLVMFRTVSTATFEGILEGAGSKAANGDDQYVPIGTFTNTDDSLIVVFDISMGIKYRFRISTAVSTGELVVTLSG